MASNTKSEYLALNDDCMWGSNNEKVKIWNCQPVHYSCQLQLYIQSFIQKWDFSHKIYCLVWFVYMKFKDLSLFYVNQKVLQPLNLRSLYKNYNKKLNWYKVSKSFQYEIQSDWKINETTFTYDTVIGFLFWFNIFTHWVSLIKREIKHARALSKILFWCIDQNSHPLPMIPYWYGIPISLSSGHRVYLPVNESLWVILEIRQESLPIK